MEPRDREIMIELNIASAIDLEIDEAGVAIGAVMAFEGTSFGGTPCRSDVITPFSISMTALRIGASMTPSNSFSA